MDNNNVNSKQQFLVLIDFSKGSYKALKYAISMAKAIKSKLVLLHVATSRDFRKTDNPSVALRAIDIAARQKEVQFKSIVEMIESEGVAVEYINTVGDVFTQIKLYLAKYKPSLIVIGKSNYGQNKLGNIANYLVYENIHNVLIIGNDFKFNKSTNISVACNSKILIDDSSNILFWLNSKTRKPLKIFVSKRKNASEEFNFAKNGHRIVDEPHKICIQNTQSFSLTRSIINHISKEKIDLVCIGRKSTNKSFFNKLFNRPNITSEVINNARIPTLIMGSIS